MKKIAVIAMLVLSCSLVSCGKGQDNTKARDWKAWLVKYEKFVDDYVVIMKKIQSGDQTAAIDAMKFAKEARELGQEAVELNKTLSDKEKEEFKKSYERISKKLEGSGLTM